MCLFGIHDYVHIIPLLTRFKYKERQCCNISPIVKCKRCGKIKELCLIEYIDSGGITICLHKGEILYDND